MCGFCGFINSNENDTKNLIRQMTKTLTKTNFDDKNTYIDETISLSDTEQIYKKILNNKEYVILYTGNLYNKDEIKSLLLENNINTNSNLDNELILIMYDKFKEKIFNYLKGIFSFVIYNKTDNELFFARDHLGVKPLFYTNPKSKFGFVFGTRIKAILAHNKTEAILDKEGLTEMFALGPAHTPGKTFFKDILELKPGHYGIYKNNNFKTYKYWDLKYSKIDDDENTAVKKIHDMLVDSTKKQIITSKPICSMLSGGIDSSILTKIANDNIENLTTFSIDFVGNDKNFVANSYQGSRDNPYIDIMKNYLKTNHINITIDNTHLFDLLEASLIARDMPGMADIDCSMYAFCDSIVKNGYEVCLSGECSDEIFGGYPWFYREDLIKAFNNNNFPWSVSNDLRANIINSNLLSKNEILDYVDTSIKNTLQDIELNINDKDELYFKKVNYLKIKLFMNTLIERTERIAGVNSLDVRIPYADYKFFEYIFNISSNLKLGKNKNNSQITEKYLLRKAFENEIPNEVLYRKKSPFPKTYDPKYLKLVENKLLEIINNENSKLNKLINKDFVLEMINIHGENITENLFGQLMTYPQTLAYLIQIEMWLNIYNVKFDF